MAVSILAELEIGFVTNVNASDRLTVFRRGGRGGDVADCELNYKDSKATGDQHGLMNPDEVEKWVQEKGIPSSSETLRQCAMPRQKVDKTPTK